MLKSAKATTKAQRLLQEVEQLATSSPTWADFANALFNAEDGLLAQAYPLGLLWGWLPCGMVYGVLTAALLSGSAARGAATMLAFGLGTLPNLLLAGMLPLESTGDDHLGRSDRVEGQGGPTEHRRSHEARPVGAVDGRPGLLPVLAVEDPDGASAVVEHRDAVFLPCREDSTVGIVHPGSPRLETGRLGCRTLHCTDRHDRHDRHHHPTRPTRPTRLTRPIQPSTSCLMPYCSSFL